MLESAKDEEIVRAVINLSATLGLRVIAEGIETAEHLARLRELGSPGTSAPKFVPEPGFQKFTSSIGRSAQEVNKS